MKTATGTRDDDGPRNPNMKTTLQRHLSEAARCRTFADRTFADRTFADRTFADRMIEKLEADHALLAARAAARQP
jgi:hypothetical protein